MPTVISNTPWEQYTIDNMTVNVKREDLCCPEPGPSFSKIRGVDMHLHYISHVHGNVPIGVLDTAHSKAGWGVAYVCKEYGLPVYDFFPVYKREETDSGYTLRENQIKAEGLGATLVPMNAGMSAVLYHQAKKYLLEVTNGKGYMMPNALKLPESVQATEDELWMYTPKHLMGGTWIISASSATLAAGVLAGLARDKRVLRKVCLIIHLGYSRNQAYVMKYLLDMSGVTDKFDVVMVDEGYEYKDAVDVPCPFPCNPYYDLKAWKWLQTHAKNLQEPIVFWNVGA